MNTPTDKEIRDWYMGYGVEGRAELADVEGEAFDRYMVERDARVSAETKQHIISFFEEIALTNSMISDSAPDTYQGQHERESAYAEMRQAEWAITVVERLS